MLKKSHWFLLHAPKKGRTANGPEGESKWLGETRERKEENVLKEGKCIRGGNLKEH